MQRTYIAILTLLLFGTVALGGDFFHTHDTTHWDHSKCPVHQFQTQLSGGITAETPHTITNEPVQFIAGLPDRFIDPVFTIPTLPRSPPFI